MVESYIPDRGDLVWVNFNPQSGHEQAGTRPAIVISPQIYNEKSGLALCCPITSQVKSYPFEVPVNTKLVKGVVLSDQIKNIDWEARKVQFIEKLSSTTLNELQQKIKPLIF